MKRTQSIILTLFTLALLWYLGSALQHCTPQSKSAGSSEGYLGDKACQRCHQEAYQDWYGSHHDLAMDEATDLTVLGDFSGVTFENKGIESTFYKRDGGFFVRTEGPQGQPQEFEIEYTFGVYPLQQYMVRFPGGRIQCLHVAWDSKENKWFDLQPNERFAPDDWMHWTGGSMTWNTMCADCHSTNLQKNYDPESDTYQTTWSIIDVSCEACHGPGRDHVNFISSANHQKGKKEPGSHLYLTSNLSSKEQVEQCARCHAFRSQHAPAFAHEGELMDYYVPDILRPNIYHADGQIMEEVYVYGSFLQSKMYRHNVKCTDCHNPHSLELKAVGNALCGQCHDPKQYDVEAHHFHPVQSEGAQCVNCHMPGKYYMVNDFRRDHSFRVPRPDLSVAYGTPNACTKCHTDQTDEWAAEAVVQWYGPERAPHYSEVLAPANNGDLSVAPQLVEMVSDTGTAEIVRATALWLLSSSDDADNRQTIIAALKNPDPLIRYTAVGAMQPFSRDDRLRYLLPLVSDSIRSIRGYAAYMLADIPAQLIPGDKQPAVAEAMETYESVLRMQSDFPAGRMMIGQYYHKKGDLAQAEESYRHAIDIDPYLPQPHVNLGNMYYQQNNLDRARDEFREALRLDSNNVEAHYALGLLLAEMQQLQAALPHLRQAALLSGNPRYYYNWGLTHQHLNQPQQAAAVYQAGLEIDPESEGNLYALAILLMQQNEPMAARPFVQRLIQLDPQNPDYQQLLRILMQ